jgi:hypothetical protein
MLDYEACRLLKLFFVRERLHFSMIAVGRIFCSRSRWSAGAVGQPLQPCQEFDSKVLSASQGARQMLDPAGKQPAVW